MIIYRVVKGVDINLGFHTYCGQSDLYHEITKIRDEWGNLGSDGDPYGMSAWDEGFPKHYLFAFQSFWLLKNYFGHPRWRKAFMKHDINYLLIDVPDHHVILFKQQCVFDPEYAEIILTQNFEQLASMREEDPFDEHPLVRDRRAAVLEAGRDRVSEPVNRRSDTVALFSPKKGKRSVGISANRRSGYDAATIRKFQLWSR